MTNRGGRRSREFRRVAELFRPHRRDIALTVLCLLAASGAGVVNPLLVRVLFDRALFCGHGCPRLTVLYPVVAAMLTAAIVVGALGVAQTYLSARVGQRVMLDLRERLHSHLQGMSLQFFTDVRTGNSQSRVANDVAGVQGLVTDSGSRLVANTLIVATTMVAMTALAWELSIVALAMLPLFAWFTALVGRASRRVTAATQEAKAEMTAITEETLSVSGILLAKLFGREREESRRFGRESDRLARLQLRQQVLSQGFSAVVFALFTMTPAAVYLIAGSNFARGVDGTALSAGTLVAFIALQSRLFFPISQIFELAVDIRSSLAMFDRIFECLEMARDVVDRPRARVVTRSQVRGAVRLRNVHFGYGPPTPSSRSASTANGSPGGHQRWALDDVSMEIAPGQLAAIVGPSGAGKTTIAYLIRRLYDVNSGSVSIDGIDVRDIRLASLSEIVGMVTQETHLLNASVRENLLYARPGASDAEVETAARAAHIHERIRDLDRGYEAVVGERGFRMSGGERQRLAIARVILKDPSIIILDESTSSLDAVSERQVRSALVPLLRGRTTIAIAHRLSTVLSADVIFVMDRGQLVDRGTHIELLRRSPLYAQLHGHVVDAGAILDTGPNERAVAFDLRHAQLDGHGSPRLYRRTKGREVGRARSQGDTLLKTTDRRRW